MKKIKKSFTILTLFVLLLGIGLSNPTTAAAKKKKVKAKSVSLNYTKKTLQVGKSVKLKASVKPAKAKAKIKWSSSNKKVVTVSSKGNAKAKKKGSVKVTAAVKGTKLKKRCRIIVEEKAVSETTTAAPAANVPAPVNSGTSVPVVSPTPTPIKDTALIVTQSDVSKALAEAKEDPKITTVKVATEKAVEIELPEGDYSELNLLIDAPNAEVSNHAVFKKITINRIAKDTYTECAEDNVIDVNCPIGRIVIKEGATAKLNIVKDNADVAVVVDGVASGIDVTGENSTVDISGKTAESIPVKASVESEIKTSHVLEVNASAKIVFVIYPGAEDSVFYVDHDGLIPTVYGVGSIQVNLGNGDVQTVIAEYRDEVSGEQQIVSLEGSIVDDDTMEPRTGASVYLVPYTNNFDETGIEENEYRQTATTDETGKYTIDSIRTGNYIMVVKEPGMVTAIQYLVITSRYGSVFQNETLRLFTQEEDNAPGSITGILSNSVDGVPIEGLTARLRKGKGNTVGSILAKTVSNSGGSYTFEGVDPGYYTVEFVDLRGQSEGYITTSMNAAVRSGRTNVVSPALTKSVSASQVRFVLTWGDESSGAPADLDSHLTGPKKEGAGHFHTYYVDRTFEQNDVKYADLDHDDLFWEGPETTTIYEAVSGVYDFYIHDFSNKDLTKSTALATSGAKVEVYQGTTLMLTYYVPNNEGTVWHVCSYDSTTGTLTQNNEMYYESDSMYVGSDPKDRALNSLDVSLTKLETVLGRLKNNDAKKSLEEKYEEYKAYSMNASSASLEDIQEKAGELSELIDKLNNELYIRDISFTDSDDSAEISNYDASILISTLDSSKVAIENVDVSEGTRYELVKGQDGILSAIEITSADGYVMEYTVSYEFPSRYFYIGSVEGSNISDWDNYTEYDEDDNIKGYVLKVCTTDGNAADITVVPQYSDEVDVKYEKDADGRITEVRLQVGSAERVYRVEYVFDENLLVPSAIGIEAEENLEWDYDYDYNDDFEKEYYVTIMTDNTEEGINCVVTPKIENAQVEYNRDETTGFVKSFTISMGDKSRTYQVRTYFNQSLLLPSTIESEDEAYYDWDWDYTYDDNDERIYSIIIETETGESCDFTVTPKLDKAEVSYGKEGGVIKNVTINIGGQSRTYQVSYTAW